MSIRACVRAEALALVLAAASPLAHAADPLGLELATTLGAPRAAADPVPHAADDPLRLKLANTLGTPRPAYEAMIVEVSVNRQKRGEFTLYRREEDLYVKAAELAALGLAGRAADAALVRIEGEDFVALRALSAQRVALDEARLALEIEFPPPALAKSTYDLGLRRQNPPAPSAPGAFLNYRLSASDGSGAEVSKQGLAHELAVRSGEALLRHEAAVVAVEGASTQYIRYATQVVVDQPARQLRFVAGDHTAASGELGSTVSLGGLNLQKFYAMTPHFIRQPLAGYAGAASTPSQVEVRMGGIPVFREQVPAGPFELKNLQQFAGARDVEVVVRDALGREQFIGFPFYFADQALRQGLHEYSYSAGVLREDLGVYSNHYSGAAATALHRYGLNDHVTIGGRGEAASGLWNFGPTVLYRNDYLGVFSAGLSASERDGRGGYALSLGQVYQRAPFGLYWNARRFSDDYATLQDLTAPASIQAENAVGGSFTRPGFGSLYLDRTITRRRASAFNHDSVSTRLGYTYDVRGLGALFVSLARVEEARPDTQAFVGVLVMFDRTKSLHLSAQRHSASGDTTLGAQFGEAVPSGEGFGYRFGYDGLANAETQDYHGFAQYNARAASFTAEGAAARNSGEGASRYELAVAGALTWADQRFGLTRHIDDSFVAVQLATPLEGVRVFSNNQEIGRTDREGRLLVPNVGSFYETQIAIDEADVPLDYAITTAKRVVALPYRSGSLVSFDVRRLRAIEGTLSVKGKPAEHALVRIGGQEIMTGREGRYYIEDLAPGWHEGVVGGCRFFLNVPDSQEPVAVLPRVSACE
jgi:outer membrane usher protein